MKRKCLKFFMSVFLVFIAGLSVLALPVAVKGYQMYQEAISEKSIEEAVAQLKADKDYVTIDEISQSYLKSVVASEDKRFYKHGAIDPISIMRAFYIDIKERRFAEGGSTITQQLAKNMYFSFEKKMERKVAEVFVARELEKRYSKDEILEMYCNVAYFGEGCYGLAEAASHYYGVTPLKLSEGQVRALVWTLKSPNNYNPQVYEAVNTSLT